jgi:Flp pilus assembly protein TadG
MKLQTNSSRRSGAAVVEAAFVVPVLLLLLIGTMSGALMVISADEVAAASREGARYASVHGKSYAFNTGKPAATPEDIRQFVLQQSVTLDPSQVTVTTTWDTSNRPGHFVTVEVRYQWTGLWPFGDREFVCRSTQLVTY